MAAHATREQSNFPPDFGHVRSWIFDLDNTLYREETRIFAQIEARMTRFVGDYLDLSPDAARLIQKRYYREHGTTLNGLVRLHGLEPETFLDYVHAIDLSALKPEEELIAEIARLPGRRFVFTNGCARHARRVLGRLGLETLFDDIWDIRTLGFRPKPEEAAYEAVASRCGPGTNCAMFDDLARNLVPAHRRGMTTVWLKGETQHALDTLDGPDFPVASGAHIDHEIGDLAHFLSTVRI